MNRNTTKPAGDVADAKLFGDWFDLIAAVLRTKAHGIIETTIAGTFDRFYIDPARPLRIAPALDLDPFVRFEILGMGIEMLELTQTNPSRSGCR
jgi:hypothetical protein